MPNPGFRHFFSFIAAFPKLAKISQSLQHYNQDSILYIKSTISSYLFSFIYSTETGCVTSPLGAYNQRSATLEVCPGCMRLRRNNYPIGAGVDILLREKHDFGFWATG